MPASKILLAFANDWTEDRRRLRRLMAEGKAITGALEALVARGDLSMTLPVLNATTRDVVRAFQEHRNRVQLFHFGGHADGTALQFEREDGARTDASAAVLAHFLGKQRGLVLVFLNGCNTAPQVKLLRSSGVKAVIATTAAVRDDVAAELARAFYAELIHRPLREAFETALEAVRLQHGDDPNASRRDVVKGLPGRPMAVGAEDARLPWILDCDPSVARWRLGEDAAWRRRGVVAGLVLGVGLLVTLATTLVTRQGTMTDIAVGKLQVDGSEPKAALREATVALGSPPGAAAAERSIGASAGREQPTQPTADGGGTTRDAPLASMKGRSVIDGASGETRRATAAPESRGGRLASAPPSSPSPGVAPATTHTSPDEAAAPLDPYSASVAATPKPCKEEVVEAAGPEREVRLPYSLDQTSQIREWSPETSPEEDAIALAKKKGVVMCEEHREDNEKLVVRVVPISIRCPAGIFGKCALEAEVLCQFRARVMVSQCK